MARAASSPHDCGRCQREAGLSCRLVVVTVFRRANADIGQQSFRRTRAPRHIIARLRAKLGKNDARLVVCNDNSVFQRKPVPHLMRDGPGSRHSSAFHSPRDLHHGTSDRLPAYSAHFNGAHVATTRSGTMSKMSKNSESDNSKGSLQLTDKDLAAVSGGRATPPTKPVIKKPWQMPA